MGVDTWILYLLIVNTAGFLFFSVNILLRKHTKKARIDLLWGMTALIGGSLGILLAMLIMDRKAEKDNMMSKVFVACVVIVQAVAVLFVNGFHREELTLDLFTFLLTNKIIIVYLLLINIVTFIVFAIDKYNAVKERSRIRIVTLLLLSFFGGSIGGLAAMYIFRHKTKVNYFTVGLPMILLTHIILLFYIMNI